MMNNDEQLQLTVLVSIIAVSLLLLLTTDSVFLLLTGLALAALPVWKTRKWHVSDPEKPDQVDAPPGNLPAPAIPLLTNYEVGGVRTVMAVVLEMCRKGSLTMGVLAEPGLSWRSWEIYLTKHETSSDRRWEQSLLDILPVQVRLSDLDATSLLDGIGLDLGELLHDKGIFAENPVKVWKDAERERIIWKILKGLSIALLIVGSWFLVGRFCPDFVPMYIMCTLYTPVLLWKSFLFEASENVGKINPTSAGLREINQWHGFEKFLVSSDRLDPAEAADYFDQYLPYAAAFGVFDTWIEKGAEAGILVPVWLHFPGVDYKYKTNALRTCRDLIGTAFGCNMNNGGGDGDGGDGGGDGGGGDGGGGGGDGG